jgi:hypothetical protein
VRTWEYLLEHGGDADLMADSEISPRRRLKQSEFEEDGSPYGRERGPSWEYDWW